MNKQFNEILTGILIDPFEKKVTSVKVDTTNILKSMYNLIGCSMVEVVSFGDVNHLWVDEAGLLKRTQRFFKVSNLPFGHHGVIVGRALLLKCGDEGGCESTTLSIEDVLPRISWDFVHEDLGVYNSDTGLFTKVIVEDITPKSDLIDSIKSIQVICD